MQHPRCHGKRDSIELSDLETCENLIEKISFRLNKCDEDEMINHCEDCLVMLEMTKVGLV